MKKRVVIAGSRNFNDYEMFANIVGEFLKPIYEEYEIIIVSGHCSGTDLMGERYAKENGFEVEIDKHVLLPVTDNTPVASPGMLYRHYAPKAKMELVRGDDDKVIEYIKLKTEYNDKKYGVLCFDGEANNFNCHTIEYGTPEKPITLSQSLFNALREFDKTDVEMIFPVLKIRLAVFRH